MDPLRLADTSRGWDGDVLESMKKHWRRAVFILIFSYRHIFPSIVSGCRAELLQLLVAPLVLGAGFVFCTL